MKVRLTNNSVVDICVDINGDNNPESKVIIHPKTLVSTSISDSQLSFIKQLPGVIVQVISN